jgi:hypothetical protein
MQRLEFGGAVRPLYGSLGVKGLMELFTATGKTEKKIIFWQLEMFDVCTAGDTAHIDMICKFLPHTHVNMGASIFVTAAMIRRGFRSARSRGNGT